MRATLFSLFTTFGAFLLSFHQSTTLVNVRKVGRHTFTELRSSSAGWEILKNKNKYKMSFLGAGGSWMENKRYVTLTEQLSTTRS